MSKKYQYFAIKRSSSRYFDAKDICKFKCHNNHTTCKICLKKAGRTRDIQQNPDAYSYNCFM